MALASLYNFSDESALSAFSTTVSRLIKILESESEDVIDWFKKNKMVVNSDKFQAILLLDKRKVMILMNVLLLIISKLKLCYL